MSIPRRHHYLPIFYIERWARDGEVYRYVRPRGKDGNLDCRRKPCSAVGYAPDLYQLPDLEGQAESQSLELNFFQRVDDRAATALMRLDRGERGSAGDRIALSQFVISLLHRSPSRLKAIQSELAKVTEQAPYRDLEGAELDTALKSATNRLLASLVESQEGIEIVNKFKAFRVEVNGAKKKLITSDRPVTLSSQLIANDAFMILPYAPDRLLILAHKNEVASAFSNQKPDILVAGINRAIVEQSEDMVIAADNSATPMIDEFFLRSTSEVIRDPLGYVRRSSPLVDLSPKARTFSWRDKIGMRYL
ncbi:MAG: DUF4238 domain-containing protein [Novosphingobium sp.]